MPPLSNDGASRMRSSSLSSTRELVLFRDGSNEGAHGAHGAHPGIPASRLLHRPAPQLGEPSQPIDIRGRGQARGGRAGILGEPPALEWSGDHPHDLRKWTSGHPPKQSPLGDGSETPSRFQMSRRATLADMPELDHLLASALIEFDGSKYLPLSVMSIHFLAPLWNGTKPIADTLLFENILITYQSKYIKSAHAMAALDGIGKYCKKLLIKGPIRADGVGHIFEGGDNDGQDTIDRLPNLEEIYFTHADDVRDFNAVIAPGVQFTRPE